MTGWKMDSNLITPDEYTEPIDLKNLGLKCKDCRSIQVIFTTTDFIPGFPGRPGIPAGTYCYKCLLAHCGRSQAIPTPMEWDLYQRIKVDLGLEPTKTIFIMPG